MRKSIAVRLLMMSLCLAGVLAFSAAYHRVRAQNQQPTSPLNLTHETGAPANGSHALGATYFSWANSQIMVGTGYQPVDPPLTAPCAASGGCTIGIEQHVQVGLNYTANNRWAMCTQVDGNFIHTPGCPFQGLMPTDGFYVVGAFAQQAHVTQGNHVLQTFVYTDFGVQVETYSVIYRVYNP